MTNRGSRHRQLRIEDLPSFGNRTPRRSEKKAALGSWKRIKPDAALFDKIMAAVEAAKGSKQWQRDDGQIYTEPRHMAQSGRWDDELEEVKTHGAGANQQHTGQGDGSFALSASTGGRRGLTTVNPTRPTLHNEQRPAG